MLSFAVALALASSSPAAPSAADPTDEADRAAGHALANPDWLKRPNGEDLMSVWPKEAMRRGIGGKATIKCQVAVTGLLRNCGVVAEEPAGMGFGQAALALTPQFLMKPKTRDGQPVEGGVVIIPITFKGGEPIGAASTRIALANVDWKAVPTYEQVAAAYPAKARARGVGGRVALVCDVLSRGRVSFCTAAQEDPKAIGFEEAAKALAKQFVAPATLSDGKSTTGAEAHLLISFSPAMLDPKAQRPTIEPLWAASPDGEAFVAAFPARAKAAGVNTGKVKLSCVVSAEGTLAQCETVSEDPAGLGFAEALKSLAPQFRMSLWSKDGFPTAGSRIVLPVTYSLEEDPAPAPPKP